MRSKSGFTLIEIILVIVVLGILMAVAIPRFNFNNKLAYTTAKKLADDLRFTRSLAINKGINHYLLLSPSSPYTQYAIFDSSTDPDTQIGETRTIPTGVNCTASTSTFQFNYLGACNSGVDGTVTLVGEGETSVVDITGFTGRAYAYVP